MSYTGTSTDWSTGVLSWICQAVPGAGIHGVPGSVHAVSGTSSVPAARTARQRAAWCRAGRGMLPISAPARARLSTTTHAGSSPARKGARCSRQDAVGGARPGSAHHLADAADVLLGQPPGVAV